MSLKEFCEALGVSRRTVQGYEEAGLLKPAGRNKYGYLLYDEDKAFMGCGLISLDISDSTTSFGEYAFSYCDKLESVLIGEGETYIDEYGFYNCEDLTDVVIGGTSDSDKNKITLEDKVFMGCGIVNLSIAGGTIEMGDYAFSYCEDLVSATIGSGSLGTGKSVFYGCSDDLIITYDGLQYGIDGFGRL